MVPCSSEDSTRAMRGQPRRLSQNYLRLNGGIAVLHVLISFHSNSIADMFSAISTVFLFGRTFVCFVLLSLFGIWLFTELNYANFDGNGN